MGRRHADAATNHDGSMAQTANPAHVAANVSSRAYRVRAQTSHVQEAVCSLSRIELPARPGHAGWRSTAGDVNGRWMQSADPWAPQRSPRPDPTLNRAVVSQLLAPMAPSPNNKRKPKKKKEVVVADDGWEWGDCSVALVSPGSPASALESKCCKCHQYPVINPSPRPLTPTDHETWSMLAESKSLLPCARSA